MIETVSSMDGLSTREPGLKAVDCRVCGGRPFVRSLVDEMGLKVTYVGCSCGQCIPVDGLWNDDAIRQWNKANAEVFEPERGPWLVPAPAVCLTCRHAPRCTAVKGMDDGYRVEHVCGEYAK